MTGIELLKDGFGRLPALVQESIEPLSDPELTARVDAEANTVAWLIWHLARIQDDQVGNIARDAPLWTRSGWAERWALPWPPEDNGYGHDAEQVGMVTGRRDLLLGYFEAVHAQSMGVLGALTDPDLDRVLDDSWDPPVTVGVRLVSTLADGFEHGAEANFVRGILQGRRRQ